MTKFEPCYRRHLPHHQPEGATFHVVFRLKGSLPGEIIERLRAEREAAEPARRPGGRKLAKASAEQEKIRRLHEYRREFFECFDALLDGDSTGPLQQPGIAEIVKEALHYRASKEYDLVAYCIMSNHVHLVIELVGRNDIPTYST